MAELLISNGGTIELGSLRVTVGSREGCDYMVLEDSGLAPEHFYILPHGDGYILRDGGSGGETLVNGKAVALAILEHGDEIQAGNLCFEYSHLFIEEESWRDAEASNRENSARSVLPLVLILAVSVLVYRLWATADETRKELAKQEQEQQQSGIDVGIYLRGKPAGKLSEIEPRKGDAVADRMAAPTVITLGNQGPAFAELLPNPNARRKADFEKNEGAVAEAEPEKDEKIAEADAKQD